MQVLRWGRGARDAAAGEGRAVPECLFGEETCHARVEAPPPPSRREGDARGSVTKAERQTCVRPSSHL
eukprot:scaffold20099_cov69-Isochrysis_galbana.AAC.1